MKISVVSPVYRAENIVADLVVQISDALESFTDNYEILLVEDGSPDFSWEQIVIAASKNKHVRGIKLSRNFGQHIAIHAGLRHATGDWIVVMDCDLQDDPSEIPNLFSKISNDVDAVIASRETRKDNWLKRFTSKIFYRLFSFLAGIPFDHKVANYGIYSRRIIKAILRMGDYEKYFPAMIQWVGFKKIYLPVNHSIRHSGSSSYNYARLIRLAINNIIAFSDKPLKITALVGLALSGIAFVVALIYFAISAAGIITVSGFASLIISIYMVGGITIFALGLVGIYLSKTFSKVKNRPLYLIENAIQFD